MSDGRIYTETGTITEADQSGSSVFIITRPQDGAELIRINLTTGQADAQTIEAASEAGRVFVEAIRAQMARK